MTPIEANAVLAQAGQFDGRKPDADTAISWAEALDGYRLDDCLAAVKAHYRDSDRWVMPVHITSRVKAIRNDRIERARPFVIAPAWIDELPEAQQDAAEAKWRAGEFRRIADGDPVRAVDQRAEMPADVRQALTALRPPARNNNEETA